MTVAAAELEGPEWLLELGLSDLPADPVLPDAPGWLVDAPPSWELLSDGGGGCSCACSVEAITPVAGLDEPTAEDGWVEEWTARLAGPLVFPLPPLPRAPDPEPVRWAVPDVWDDDPPMSSAPVLGDLVGRLVTLVEELDTVDPVTLPGALALSEAEALFAVAQRLRVQQLTRVRDVETRGLFSLSGYRGPGAWWRSVAPDADRADRTLASRLTGLPHLHGALRDGAVSLSAARRVATALRKVTGFLDRPDGLIDGQPGEDLVAAVVDNSIDLIGRGHGGLTDDHPLLAEVTARVAGIHAAGGAQQARVEQAFTLLAAHLPDPAGLKAALEEQVFAIVPNLLEEQQRTAEQHRGLALTRRDDGSWEVSGRLTPQCGERLFSALAAEARRDPANPVDTARRARAREAEREAQAARDGTEAFLLDGYQTLPGWEQDAATALAFSPAVTPDDRSHAEAILVQRPNLSTTVSGEASDAAEVEEVDVAVEELATLMPRTRSRRVHDALDRLLERYLGHGLGGVSNKVPVQVAVTLPHRLVEQQPGALPGKASSGRPLPASLLRRWWCDSHVTPLLLSRGWLPLGAAHSGRTTTAVERKATQVQHDHRCAGLGCCPGYPDPLIPLVPHHVIRFASAGRTSLAETLLVCPNLHHDLHTGKKTLRLRNGRLLNEHGYLED